MVTKPALRAPEPGVPRAERVLLLVDVINPFRFDGAAKLAPAALAVLPAIVRLRRDFGARKLPVVYANDHFGHWRQDVATLVAACRRRSGAAAALARQLAPRRRDFVVLKPRHSAFDHTPLELLLQQMGARSLVIAGLAADLCVQFSAADAYARGYQLWVPADCVAADSGLRQQAALAWMAQALRCDIRPANGGAEPDGVISVIRMPEPAQAGSDEGHAADRLQRSVPP